MAKLLCYYRMTNSPVFPGHALSWLFSYKVMKCPGFPAIQQNIRWVRRMRQKKQDKEEEN